MTELEKKEYKRQWYLKNKEKIQEQSKQYYKDNKEKIQEQSRQYYKDNKEKRLEYNKKYREKNKDEIKEYNKQWKEENPDYAKEWFQKNKDEISEKRLEYSRKWRKTPYGRAAYLLNEYNQSDIKAERGKGDLTSQWIVDNIFSKSCPHCGKTGWNVIGCNRLDNSKPHTMDNVEPCCEECNKKLPRGRYKKISF